MPVTHTARGRDATRLPTRRQNPCSSSTPAWPACGMVSNGDQNALRPVIASSAGQDGEHRQHRQHDAHRADRAEAGGGVHVRQREAEQRRDHRSAGRDDGRPGALHRDRDRLVLVLVAAQLLAVAGHEQQRVVRARAEHEHRQDAARLAVDREPGLAEHVARAARGGLGEHDAEERDGPEDRRAVDRDQQDEHDARRREQERAVDAAEDLDRVERVARRAGELDLEPVRGLARPVGDLLDRGLELVPDAPAGLHRLDDQRGRPVLAEDRFLRFQDQFGAVLVELRAGLVDALPVGLGEPALALEHDHCRCELPARELLDGFERLHGLRVPGEE